MNIRYTPAQIRDLTLLMQLMEEFYELDGHILDVEKARKALKDLIENEAYGRIWLIVADSVTAGYAAITLGYSLEYHGRDAIVDEIYLREPYRGKGIGTQTFAFIEAECQKIGVNALHLEVMLDNQKAYDFYRKLGYEGRPSNFLHKWLPGKS